MEKLTSVEIGNRFENNLLFVVVERIGCLVRVFRIKS